MRRLATHLPSTGVSSESESSTRPPLPRDEENFAQLPHLKQGNGISSFKLSGTLDMTVRWCCRTPADLQQKKTSASIFYTQHMPGSEHGLFLVINNVLFLEICSCFVTFLRSPEKTTTKKTIKKKTQTSLQFVAIDRKPKSLPVREKEKVKKTITHSAVFLIASLPVVVHLAQRKLTSSE